jgi:hypothetical protein
MAQGIGQWEKEMLTWARAPASACTKKKKNIFYAVVSIFRSVACGLLE